MSSGLKLTLLLLAELPIKRQFEKTTAPLKHTLHDQNGRLILSGRLTEAPETRVQLPDDVSRVSVRFHDDPRLVTYLRLPITNQQAQKAIQAKGWFERMSGALASAGDWAAGVVAGDFNEDPTLSQIIVNTAVTMIPLVDQAGDVRDISAHLKMLLWDGRYAETMVWVGLGPTLIGKNTVQ